MGRQVALLSPEIGGVSLVGGIVRDASVPDEVRSLYPRLVVPEASGDLIRGADVVLDVSAPAFLARLLERQREALQIGRASWRGRGWSSAGGVCRRRERGEQRRGRG